MITVSIIITTVIITYFATAYAYNREIKQQLEFFERYYVDRFGFKRGEFRYNTDGEKLVWDSDVPGWCKLIGPDYFAPCGVPVGVKRSDVSFTDGIEFTGVSNSEQSGNTGQLEVK